VANRCARSHISNTREGLLTPREIVRRRSGRAKVVRGAARERPELRRARVRRRVRLQVVDRPAGTDRRDCWTVRSGQREAHIHALSAFREQPNGVVLRKTLGSTMLAAGASSGFTGYSRSPYSRSATRLVTRTLSSGHLASSPVMIEPASRTCSKCRGSVASPSGAGRPRARRLRPGDRPVLLLVGIRAG
jgi:hypothetical protein